MKINAENITKIIKMKIMKISRISLLIVSMVTLSCSTIKQKQLPTEQEKNEMELLGITDLSELHPSKKQIKAKESIEQEDLSVYLENNKLLNLPYVFDIQLSKNQNEILKTVDEIVKKECIKYYKEEHLGKISRIENNTDITYCPANQVLGPYNVINKKNFIEADFNNDQRIDIIVQKTFNTGQIETKSYFLFLNTVDGLKYTGEYGLRSEYKNDKNLYARYDFQFEKVNGNLLEGKSYYYKSEDAHSSPSYFCIEKYGFNIKKKIFELVYQSKLYLNN